MNILTRKRFCRCHAKKQVRRPCRHGRECYTSISRSMEEKAPSHSINQSIHDLLLISFESANQAINQSTWQSRDIITILNQSINSVWKIRLSLKCGCVCFWFLGLEKLEALQVHENPEIYQKALEIIEIYFGADDEDAEVLEERANDHGQYSFSNDYNAAANPQGGFKFWNVLGTVKGGGGQSNGMASGRDDFRWGIFLFSSFFCASLARILYNHTFISSRDNVAVFFWRCGAAVLLCLLLRVRDTLNVPGTAGRFFHFSPECFRQKCVGKV